MQDSDIPAKLYAIWANAATSPYVRTVPVASQIGIQNGAASLTDGFPPHCFIPLAAGGAGPFGSDTNGILKQISALVQWLQMSAPMAWDSAYSAAIGGYPAQSIVSSTTIEFLYWQSTVDNNLTNPDAGGAGWMPLRGSIASSKYDFRTPGSGTFIVPAGVQLIKYIQVWGPGGGGGGSSGGVQGGCGGGGGGYIDYTNFAVTPGETISYTVGTGGTAGASGGGDGAAGSTSVFGPLQALSGGGGTGGSTSFQVPGVSGQTGTGGTTFFGGSGGMVVPGATSLGGSGGAAGYGGGAGGPQFIGPPNDGVFPGGGGAGAGAVGSYAGGTGANGRILLEY